MIVYFIQGVISCGFRALISLVAGKALFLFADFFINLFIEPCCLCFVLFFQLFVKSVQFFSWNRNTELPNGLSAFFEVISPTFVRQIFSPPLFASNIIYCS